MQMRVERINIQSFDSMTQHDVIPVVGQPRMRVDVGHRAVRSGHDWISRFAALIALQAANVQPLMHLRTIASHAAESPGRPRLPNRPYKKSFLAAFLKKGMVRGRQLKRLGAD